MWGVVGAVHTPPKAFLIYHIHMSATAHTAEPLKSIADIRHGFYINLESRPDRRALVETELPKVGLSPDYIKRFNAVCLPKKSGSGAIGCSMSHLRCLEIARKNGWGHCLIVEDDIVFTDPGVFVASMNQFLAEYGGGGGADTPRFDVCLIAGNNVAPVVQRHPFCAKVAKCQTTTGYLVMAHYYDTLIENYREGIRQLMSDPDCREGLQYTACQLTYSIDKWWFQLQGRDQWFLITPLTVTQRADYSDIECRQTNYDRVMLALDKSAMFRGWGGGAPSPAPITIGGGVAAATSQRRNAVTPGQLFMNRL